MDRVLIFGTGSVANTLVDSLDISKVDIVAFVNSDYNIKSFREHRVIVPDKISKLDYDYIIIASGYTVAIKKILLEKNIDERKIVAYIYDDGETYQELSKEVNQYLDAKYNRNLIDKWLLNGQTISKFYPAIMWKNSCVVKNIYKDYVREQTVNLLAGVLEDKKIQGSVAELGVFRGDFTIIINEIFRNRRLYLYDTFEGFSERDIEKDKTIDDKQGEKSKFKDTSAELVLSRLTYRDNVVIKKGYFPDTFDISNEKFSFVSIDLNLYNPVINALRLFYPCMSKGGYILVSDYHAPFYEGTKKAVDDWCGEENVSIIPVADLYGSVLIVKE